MACVVNIPGPEIIDIVMNPSDFEIYSEEGKGSSEAVAENDTEENKQKNRRIQFIITDDGNKQFYRQFKKYNGSRPIDRIK